MSKKRTKSRKKLTEEEAYKKIENIAMQIQNESEMILINLKPNRGKLFNELDKSVQFILLTDSYISVDEAIDYSQESIKNMEWKITEDYARFLSPGIHQFVTGLVINKKDPEAPQYKTHEQMEFF